MDYKKILNERILSIKPSGIRRFFDIAAQMENVISLSIGEPDFVTPEHIRAAGIKSLNEGKTSYTANYGLIELRKEISKYLSERFNVEYDPSDEVLVTVGGSEAIDIVLRAILETGDEVLIPEPAFVSYAPLAELYHGVAKPIVTKAENGFKLMPEELKAAITPKTKAIVLTYPNNPTGATMNRDEFMAIADVLKDTDILVIADEIYAELSYKQKHTSFASLPGMRERTVLVSGFSKTFAMTGWRLGYCCAPRELMQYIGRVHQFAIMSAPSPAQYAAIEALRNGLPDTQYMCEKYNERRQYLYKELLDMGFECFEPEGAFYLFVKAPDGDDIKFSAEAKKQRLLLVPATGFGCKGWVRIAYCVSPETIARSEQSFIKLSQTYGK